MYLRRIRLVDEYETGEDHSPKEPVVVEVLPILLDSLLACWWGLWDEINHGEICKVMAYQSAVTWE
jgi:hypothetical protein